MKVQVMSLKEFWDKYNQHRTVIDRCFHYLLRKYPDKDGVANAYNTMLTKMYDLDVFNKFNPKKIVAKKMGISKHQAGHKVSDTDCSAENLEKLGINIDKKYEQFLFKYIEHILQEAYMNRSKYSKRYILGSGLTEIPPRSSTEMRVRMNENQWAQTEEELENLKSHLDKKDTLRTLKVYPNCDDSEMYTGSKEDAALDRILVEDLQKKFRSLLSRANERKVYDLTVEGLPNNEISYAMNCTPQNVSLLMGRIREKFERFMQKQLVEA